MPVANEIRVVLSGLLPKSEIWTFGVSVAESGPFTQADLQTMVDNFAALLTSDDLVTFLRANNPSSVVITNVNARFYDTTGGPAAFSADHAVSLAGTSSASTVLPNQVAMVVTLNTGFSGRSFRGRCYLPVLCPPSTQVFTSDYTNTTVDDAANGMIGYLDDIEATFLGNAVVASTVQGVMTTITEVSCNSKADTQRRRAAGSTIDYTKVVAR